MAMWGLDNLSDPDVHVFMLTIGATLSLMNNNSFMKLHTGCAIS